MKRMWSKNELKKIQEVLLGSGEIPSIKADEIIENMSGYAMALGTIENATIESVYGGIVKNGNKLTIVLAVEITRTDTITGNASIVSMTIPKAIADKIAVAIGTYTVIRNRQYATNKTSADDDKTIICSLFKDDETHLSFRSSDLNNLVANSAYYFRAEYTLLLSDSLL